MPGRIEVRRWIENLRPVHEQRIFLLALGAGLPAVVVALVLLWTGSFAPQIQWTSTVAIVLVCGPRPSGTRNGYRRYVRFSNLLEAMREGTPDPRAWRRSSEVVTATTLWETRLPLPTTLWARHFEPASGRA